MIDVCRCPFCHQEYPTDVLMSFDGKKICLTCMIWHTRTCSCCGNHVWRKDALVKKDVVLCPKCAQKRELED